MSNRTFTSITSVLAASLVAFASRSAHAQVAEPNAPALAAAKATEAPPAPVAPADTTATPASPGHFRWGLSMNGGSFFPGPTTIALGPEARFGWAFSPRLSAYANLGAVGGIGFGSNNSVSSTGVSQSVSAVSYWYLGANVDAMVAGPLFVGAGAALGRGSWTTVEQSANVTGGGGTASQSVTAAGGWMPQFDARLGLTTGTPDSKTGKKTGFTIGLDMRVLVAPDAVVARQGAISAGVAQNASVTETAIGYAPMLMLGFDMR